MARVPALEGLLPLNRHVLVVEDGHAEHNRDADEAASEGVVVHLGPEERHLICVFVCFFTLLDR